MEALITGLFRYPVKGFSAEPLSEAELVPGRAIAQDRRWVVENGPSGFDPDAPAWVPKMKFAVLAAHPVVAAARTRVQGSDISASAPGRPDFHGDLAAAAGREGFGAWVEGLLGEDARDGVRVLQAPDYHFLDHPAGHISIVNLASVRDLEARIGKPVDPLRFRANLYVEGWPPWVENDWKGKNLLLGLARATVFAPIVRCAATEVDPQTAKKDLPLVEHLLEQYGHRDCGIYVQVTHGGTVRVGDACSTPGEPE
ncbi:MAG: MOSC domain-containing protein [Phenylobacterium sp.]|uniref:MOSC domain-containing protein n=1 Tax=Phenylobacterium sp. TaxID=1871053 RepID=UPI0025D1DC62|nr:MOSC N-terminal beta barrel domain-containing protein [Phenylobacterium sp.]MCA6223780.1 MOSC domain-containing protein [Phenylobacterium sp.]MCA6225358.1 MOSC domain-containing protein [Phenylobacterium sp.]MCA6231216.1 MOSC domain-containing protein [Phenylobacterium sp.]MCA6235838.1 MOSC domain-containing protein [Phenylobacterium sp.]MCA6248074.1 MOSC domain-containing protein [Phenylobacterium sp.]